MQIHAECTNQWRRYNDTTDHREEEKTHHEGHEGHEGHEEEASFITLSFVLFVPFVVALSSFSDLFLSWVQGVAWAVKRARSDSAALPGDPGTTFSTDS